MDLSRDPFSCNQTAAHAPLSTRLPSILLLILVSLFASGCGTFRYSQESPGSATSDPPSGGRHRSTHQRGKPAGDGSFRYMEKSTSSLKTLRLPRPASLKNINRLTDRSRCKGPGNIYLDHSSSFYRQRYRADDFKRRDVSRGGVAR